MPEIESTATPVVVRYRCDTCGVGEMLWTNITLTIDPPLYPHVCNGCGATQDLTQPYPETFWQW